MEGKRETSFCKLEWMINALLVAAALLSLVNVVWGLDTQDTVVEWTDAGKRLATERAARWKAKDEMVLAPAGDFLMGSDLKFASRPMGCRNWIGVTMVEIFKNRWHIILSCMSAGCRS